MILSRMSAGVMVALLMAVFAGGAGGQEVSDPGNPWIFSDDQSTWLSPVCNDGPSITDDWVLGVGSVGGGRGP